MTRIFLMSDIHGDMSAFLSLLNKVSFNSDDQLFILGDVVDRGADGIELLRYIKTHSNITLLLGNHEEMMLISLLHSDPLSFQLWIQNGGAYTFDAFERLPLDERQSLLEWLNTRPLYHQLDFQGETILLTHAGIQPYEGELSEQLKAQEREDFLWSRYNFLTVPGDELPCKIAFGHTPTHILNKYGLAEATPKTRGVFIGENRIALDCGKTSGFPLGMYCLNTGEAIYEK